MKKSFGFPFAVFKEKSSQIPHVYQPSGDFSFSSMSTNPSLSVVPSVILLLILRKLLLSVSKRQTFSSFAHLLRPEKSLGKEDINTSLLNVLSDLLLTNTMTNNCLCFEISNGNAVLSFLVHGIWDSFAFISKTLQLFSL